MVRLRGPAPPDGNRLRRAVTNGTESANRETGSVRELVFCGRLRYQSAMTKVSIDQLAGLLAESLPQGIRSMRDDLEQNFRSVLQSSLARLDLVTREEFEIQEAVLARTRAKLDALEGRLQHLESAPAAASKKTAAKKAPKKSAKKKKKAAVKKKT